MEDFCIITTTLPIFIIEIMYIYHSCDVSLAIPLFLQRARHTVCDLTWDRIGSWQIQDFMYPGSQIPIKQSQSYKLTIFVVESLLVMIGNWNKCFTKRI